MGAEHEIGFDVTRLVAVTADLLGHARTNPELLSRDHGMIADSIQQLARMLDRISHKEAAE